MVEIVLWDTAESRQAASELLGGAGDRWLHVQRVATVVEEFAHLRPVGSAILSAAWLHDIGYAAELVMTGMHAIDGAMFLDRAGAPTEVVSLVAFHTGAEFEADERGLVDELARFSPPKQDDLDLLILADLLSSPRGERTTVTKRLDEILDRYERQHPVHRAVMRSRTHLEESARRAAVRIGYPI